MTMTEWVRRLTFFVLISVVVYYFGMWRLTLSPTDFYGQPALKHYDDFWTYLSQHPESLLPLQWGLQPILLIPTVFTAITLFILQGGPIRRHRWRNMLGERKPIEAPALFLAITIPILLISLAVLGVGASLNWYTMDIVSPDGRTLRVPNPAYSYTAHRCANLLIGLPLAVFNLGFSEKKKWSVIILIMLICALDWEVRENKQVLQGGQSLEFYNSPEDSEFDITATIDSFTATFALYWACWFATATPDQIMAKKFGRRWLESKRIRLE